MDKPINTARDSHNQPHGQISRFNGLKQKVEEDGNIRVRSWEEFKRLVSEKKPVSIVFILEQAGFSPNKELTAIKLIMLHDKRYYIFIDSAKGQSLRQMGIPFHKDNNGIPNLDEDEVKAFLEKTFAKDNVKVFSFWTF